MVCSPYVRAHVTARSMYGHASGIYGETEILLGTDQYPTGMLNPFNFELPEARFRERLPVWLKMEWWTHRTCVSPAAAIGKKSSSVIRFFPVLHKHLQCGLVVLHLAKRELVNDRVVVRINENARRYPRLLASAHSSERLKD
jgi:hypothetical protein